MSPYIYVDGSLIESKQQKSIHNPATDKVIADIFVADVDIAEQALKSAKKAEKTWGSLLVEDRMSWMLKLKEAFIKNEEILRTCVHQETGKTWDGTAEDFQLLINSLGYYAEQALSYLSPEVFSDETHQHELIRQPVGVCVAYLAWNFPLLNLGYKLGPAMATGCPIIIKPSIKTPLSAYVVGNICHSIGLPAGAVQIIAGDDVVLGNYLSSSTIPSMLTLIGSIQTGMAVMEAGTTSIKHHSMELGGDAPFIVFNDADLDLAADILTAIKFGNTGQICVSANRVFVEENILESFLEKVLTRTDAVIVGWGRDSGATMGSLIDKGACSRVHNLVQNAVSNGATCLRGGIYEENSVGAYYPPTILINVSSEMNIYKQEIFGPVISICTFSDTEKMIEDANDTDAGLASYIFTKDAKKARNIASAIECGEVHINGIKYSIELPHTAIKQSGIGCDCSTQAMDEYLVLKRISTTLYY